MNQLARATSSSKSCTKSCCRPLSLACKRFYSRKLTSAELYQRMAPMNEISKEVPRETLFAESTAFQESVEIAENNLAEKDDTSYLNNSKLFVDADAVHPWAFPTICVQTAQARPPPARIVGMPFPPHIGAVVNCDVRRLEYVMSLQPKMPIGEDQEYEFEISNVPDEEQIPGALRC